jgi:CspA family cold shock protein
MNFTDHWVTNSAGEEFIFTVEMQRRLSQAGLPVEPDALDQLGSQPSKPAPAPAPAAIPQREEEFEGPETIQIDPQTGKYIGRLKWFSTAKGYGFINRGGGEDIFFHKTAIAEDQTQAQLDEGTWVLYDVEERKKGLEAADVEIYQQGESE